MQLINKVPQLPFFSIVIVNYNHGQFLEEAIDSILKQNCDDYEIIMVDGGSTDNSIDIIQKYKENFSWWVSEKDNGQSNALNKGFKHANGNIFFWLNADDLLLADTLTLAKEYFQKHPNCKWLAGNTLTMNENRMFKWCIRGPIYCDFLVKNGTVYVYGPTTFLHKDLLMTSGGFDESLNYTMDTDLWYRFVNIGVKFDRLNHYCWGFRIHKHSKTSHSHSGNYNPKYAIERLYIQKNNHYEYKFIQYMLLFWKIITGCLFQKFIDNIKYKNTKL